MFDSVAQDQSTVKLPQTLSSVLYLLKDLLIASQSLMIGFLGFLSDVYLIAKGTKILGGLCYRILVKSPSRMGIFTRVISSFLKQIHLTLSQSLIGARLVGILIIGSTAKLPILVGTQGSGAINGFLCFSIHDWTNTKHFQNTLWQLGRYKIDLEYKIGHPPLTFTRWIIPRHFIKNNAHCTALC